LRFKGLNSIKCDYIKSKDYLNKEAGNIILRPVKPLSSLTRNDNKIENKLRTDNYIASEATA
jgi:hypothetical protein